MSNSIQFVPVTLTKRAEDNIARLAIGLRTDKTRKTTFKMWDYARDPRNLSLDPCQVKYECGTSCCAVGHAPLYCRIRPKKDESWNNLAARLLGKHAVKYDSDGYDVFDFLFQSDWPDDIKQFSARVWHVLRRGTVIDGSTRFTNNHTFSVPRIKDLQAYLLP